MSNAAFIESECACLICVMMCTTPCWPTPDEAQRLIDAGYGHRLQLETEPHGSRILKVIVPKSRGGWCTFNSERGNCVLHKKGLKPLEGRLASCKEFTPGQDIRNHVVEFWANDKAQEFAVAFHVDRLRGRR